MAFDRTDYWLLYGIVTAGAVALWAARAQASPRHSPLPLTPEQAARAAQPVTVPHSGVGLPYQLAAYHAGLELYALGYRDHEPDPAAPLDAASSNGLANWRADHGVSPRATPFEAMVLLDRAFRQEYGLPPS